MSMNPTLIVGIGGTGKLALLEIKKEMLKYTHNKFQFPYVKLLAIDTEFLDEKKEGFAEANSMDTGYEKKIRNSVKFSEHEIIEIDVQKTYMKEFIRDPEKIGAGDFVSQDKIRNIEKEIEGYGAGGYGIVGKMALWPHLGKIKNSLEGIIKNFTDKDFMVKSLNRYNEYCDNKKYKIYEYDNNTDINVIVIGSVGGGTGKGIFLTTGVLINEILKAENRADNSMRMLVNYMPSCFTSSGRNVGSYIDAISTNQYTSFKELEYVLKNGYQTEKTIRQLFNNRDDVNESKQIYTDVINVSKRIEESRVDIGSYEIINKNVAEVVVSYMFSGLTGKLKAFFKSNKGSFKEANKIKEKDALGADRVRDYGRLGRHKLVLPLAKLVDYSKLDMIDNIMEDIKNGDIISKELRKTRSEDSEKTIETIKLIIGKVKDEIVAGKYLEFQRPIFTKESIKTKSYEDNIAEQVNQQVNALYSTFQNYISTGRMEKNENDLIDKIINGNQSFKGIVGELKKIIKISGLDSVNYIINELKNLLKIEVETIFKNELPKLDNDMKFTLENGYADLEKNIRDIKIQRENTVKEYLNLSSDFYKEIENAIFEDKKNWEKEHSGIGNKILNLVGKPEDDKNLSDNSNQKLKEFAEKFNNVLRSYIDGVEKESCLRAYNICYGRIKNISDIIEKNMRVVENEGKFRKELREKKREIVKRDTSILENEIVGNRREEEYDNFSKYIYKKVYLDFDEIERKLNENFMEEFIIREITDENIYLSLKEYLDRLEGAKESMSITKYINELSEDSQIKYINMLMNHGSFLGEIDTTKAQFESGTELSSKFCFIETDDKSVVQRVLKTINKEVGVDYAEGKSNEEIAITRLETALPLYVFSELYKTREVYLQKLKENRDTSEFKHQRHTHKAFVEIEEPIGSTSQMSDFDKAMFIDLLLHTKIIEIDSKYDIVKIYKNGKYVNYIDTRADKDKTEIEQSVLLDEFYKNLNQRNDWFLEMTKEIWGAMLKIYQITKMDFNKDKTEKYLEKYFNYDHNERKQFPYIPETLLATIKNDLNTKSQTPEIKNLQKFIEEMRRNNMKKIKEMQASVSLAIYCRSYEEVKNKYREPEMSFIDILEVKSNGITESTNIKKIDMEEKIYFISIGKNNIRKAKLSEIADIIYENKLEVIYVYDEIIKKYVEYKNIEAVKVKYEEKYGKEEIPPFEEEEIPQFITE